ncbi:MAG: ATP synthase F1 subunit gamma [Bacteroidales bacterium]
MGSLKEIRIRIASIGSTEKITSAMKLVSAAKLRRAQTAIVNLRPYSRKLNEILQDLSSSMMSMEDMPLFHHRNPERVVIVVITSNKGLCGGFNSNVIKETQLLIKERYYEQNRTGRLKLICIGKKGNEQLSKYFDVIQYNETLLENSSFSELTTIADYLMRGFLKKEFDKVEIVYNQFINAATQKLVVEPFLPIQPLHVMEGKQQNHDYIIEPSKKELLNELIPKILKLQLYKALIDSIASEHGARMTSMAKATDNANEMLKELRLKYNNARQSAITNELIEIVSGAEALDN